MVHIILRLLYLISEYEYLLNVKFVIQPSHREILQIR